MALPLPTSSNSKVLPFLLPFYRLPLTESCKASYLANFSPHFRHPFCCWENQISIIGLITLLEFIIMIFHCSGPPIFCSGKSASLMPVLACSTFLRFSFLSFSIQFITYCLFLFFLHIDGNTFSSAALSFFSRLSWVHTADLWHTVSPHNSFLQQIWRWCAELCTFASAFVPLITLFLLRSNLLSFCTLTGFLVPCWSDLLSDL